MTDPVSLSDADQASIVAYVDGEMEPEAMAAFEIRLADEPELARQFATFVRVDALRQRAAPSVAPLGARPPRPHAWRLLAAAAVLAAGVLAAWWFAWRSAPPAKPQVALLASAADRRAYHDLLGLPADVVAPGTQVRGAPASGRVVATDDYLAMAHEAETRRSAAAIAARTTSIHAAYFCITLRLARAGAVAVLALDARGNLAQLYPDQGQMGAPAPRLAAGTLHLLPGTALQRDPDDADTPIFHPGFLVPRGAKELTVWVAVRDELPAFSLVQRAAQDLAGDLAPDRLEAWLAGQGFTTTRLVVGEP